MLVLGCCGGGCDCHFTPAYAATESGRNNLGAFIMRWTEHDARAAAEWLDAQPNDAKTALMRETLQNHSSN